MAYEMLTVDECLAAFPAVRPTTPVLELARAVEQRIRRWQHWTESCAPDYLWASPDIVLRAHWEWWPAFSFTSQLRAIAGRNIRHARAQEGKAVSTNPYEVAQWACLLGEAGWEYCEGYVWTGSRLVPHAWAVFQSVVVMLVPEGEETWDGLIIGKYPDEWAVVGARIPRSMWERMAEETPGQRVLDRYRGLHGDLCRSAGERI